MACRITSTDRRRRGFTLVEVMVATAIGLMAATAVITMLIFAFKSFVALTNYADIELESQLALDKMSKEIRQARQVTSYTTNSVTFLDSSGSNVVYSYDTNSATLWRYGGGLTNAYLTNCDSLQFWIYQHTVISNSFDAYSPAFVTNARLLQVTWHCARNIEGVLTNSDSVQSASIAIRNH
jgi:prepilin-type N-terminal cleavage/methylation domain-containing protein